MDCKVNLIIHGSLNDFLEPANKTNSVEYKYGLSLSVKDAIEAIGIPHPEVGLILIGDLSVDFSYLLRDGETIEVYPHLNHPSVGTDKVLPFLPDGKASFILDVHLGRLAHYLRIAGFDSLYYPKDPGDSHIAQIAEAENRIVLTRDMGLLKRSAVSYGHWLRNTESRAQFREVVHYYNLRKDFNPFSRCVKCNGLIKRVEKASIEEFLPHGIKRDFNEFYQCSHCGQIYWQGSHYKGLSEFLESF
ncbi:MAG: twitching motility protein PilT [Proteobacteria bacterium]|nr:twitching motility protein PilT [Pseudomonadota bacterium]